MRIYLNNLRNVGKKRDIVDIKAVQIHIVLLCGILEHAICQVVLIVQYYLGKSVFDALNMAVVTVSLKSQSSFL